MALSIRIDRLTNSIEQVRSGLVFDTEVVRLHERDKGLVHKKDWGFDWHQEMGLPGREVHGLVIAGNPRVLHGLICIEPMSDHVFAHLIENAWFNKGRRKEFAGVPANLMAYACFRSFEEGHAGAVSFVSKTRLKQHYMDILGAEVMHGDRMKIEGRAAFALVQRYFP